MARVGDETEECVALVVQEEQFVCSVLGEGTGAQFVQEMILAARKWGKE